MTAYGGRGLDSTALTPLPAQDRDRMPVYPFGITRDFDSECTSHGLSACRRRAA